MLFILQVQKELKPPLLTDTEIHRGGHSNFGQAIRKGPQNIVIAKGSRGVTTWMKEINLFHISIFELNSRAWDTFVTHKIHLWRIRYICDARNKKICEVLQPDAWNCLFWNILPYFLLYVEKHMTCFRASLNVAPGWYMTFLTKQWCKALKGDRGISEKEGAQFPGRRITSGPPKSPNKVTCTSEVVTLKLMFDYKVFSTKLPTNKLFAFREFELYLGSRQKVLANPCLKLLFTYAGQLTGSSYFSCNFTHGRSIIAWCLRLFFSVW